MLHSQRCIELEVVFCKANFENVVGQFIILKVNLRKAKSYMVKYTCLGCFIYGSFRAHTCLYALIITKNKSKFNAIHVDKRESYGLRIVMLYQI